jgi:hypothetical protein
MMRSAAGTDDEEMMEDRTIRGREFMMAPYYDRNIMMPMPQDVDKDYINDNNVASTSVANNIANLTDDDIVDDYNDDDIDGTDVDGDQIRSASLVRGGSDDATILASNRDSSTTLGNIDPMMLAHEDQVLLKQQLLRRYSGFMICSLKKEFLKRKKKGKLPKEARQKLLEWWTQHYKWPYPSVSKFYLTSEFAHIFQPVRTISVLTIEILLTIVATLSILAIEILLAIIAQL